MLCGEGNILLYNFGRSVGTLLNDSLILMVFQIKKAKRKAEESPWAFNPFQKHQNHKNGENSKVRLSYSVCGVCVCERERERERTNNVLAVLFLISVDTFIIRSCLAVLFVYLKVLEQKYR